MNALYDNNVLLHPAYKGQSGFSKDSQDFLRDVPRAIPRGEEERWRDGTSGGACSIVSSGVWSWAGGPALPIKGIRSY